MGLIDLHRILRAFGLGKMFEGDHPGVRPGESFVTRPSRWSGSVGGCVWLVLCVMLMSSWDDGFADTGDLASDYHGGVGHPWRAVGVVSAEPKADGRCDAEEIGGAVFGSGTAVGYPWSVVEDSVEGCSGMSSVVHWSCTDLTRRCNAEEIGGAVFGSEDVVKRVVVMSETVMSGMSRDQSTAKELDWNIGKGTRLTSSSGKMRRSTDGGKPDRVRPSPLPRKSVPEGGNYSRKGAQVPVEKQVIMKQKVPVMQEATVEAVVKRDVGKGETVNIGLSKDLCTDMVCSDFVGGAVFGVGAAGGFIPLVGAGAMMGSEHVLVVGTPKGGHVHVGGGLCNESWSAWVTWNWDQK